MQLNNSTFEGRIVKQSGVKKFSDDRSVCNFTIVHDITKDEKLFLGCSFFSTPKRAEFLGELKPGNPIIVSGRLSQDSYTDSNGVEKKPFKLNVLDFSLPSSNQKNGNGNGSATSQEIKVSEDGNSATISPTSVVAPPAQNEDVPF